MRLSSEELASGPHRLKKGGGKKEQRLDDPRSRELASETPASASPRQINAARQSNRSASAALRAKLRERSPPPRGPYVSSHLSRRRKGRNDTFAGSCSKFYQFNIVSHTSQTTQRDAKKKVQAEMLECIRLVSTEGNLVCYVRTEVEDFSWMGACAWSSPGFSGQRVSIKDLRLQPPPLSNGRTWKNPRAICA